MGAGKWNNILISISLWFLTCEFCFSWIWGELLSLHDDLCWDLVLAVFPISLECSLIGSCAAFKDSPTKARFVFFYQREAYLIQVHNEAPEICASCGGRCCTDWNQIIFVRWLISLGNALLHWQVDIIHIMMNGYLQIKASLLQIRKMHQYENSGPKRYKVTELNVVIVQILNSILVLILRSRFSEILVLIKSWFVLPLDNTVPKLTVSHVHSSTGKYLQVKSNLLLKLHAVSCVCFSPSSPPAGLLIPPLIPMIEIVTSFRSVSDLQLGSWLPYWKSNFSCWHVRRWIGLSPSMGTSIRIYLVEQPIRTPSLWNDSWVAKKYRHWKILLKPESGAGKRCASLIFVRPLELQYSQQLEFLLSDIKNNRYHYFRLFHDASARC